MANTNVTETGGTVNRRRLLQAIGAATTVGLAGCNEGENDGDDGGSGDADGGNGGNSGQLGERVPEFVISYWGNTASTSTMEDILPVVKENLEAVGLNVKLRPVEYTTNVGEQVQDERVSDAEFMYYSPDPVRLDPNAMLERFLIDRAGNSGNFNLGQYTDCEYSYKVLEQAAAKTEEEREELVLEAQQILSEAAVVAPVSPVIEVGAAHDTIDVQNTGSAGMSHLNPNFYLNSAPVGKDSMIVDTSPVTMETKNYPSQAGAAPLAVWNNLIQSPLIAYDEDRNLQNMIAEEISRENDGARYVVTIKDDATFQNGDPVTAEDVAFTFDYLWSQPENFPTVQVPPYESIEVLNEKTVQFDFEQTFNPIAINFAKWGIIHKESWVEQGGVDSPSEFEPTNIVGSGPYEISDMEQGSYLHLEPTDNHPLHSPDHSITFQAFRSASTKIEAFREGEIDVALSISFGVFEELQNSMGDSVQFAVSEGTLPFVLTNNYGKVPTKFHELRDAIGKSIDRALINEVAFYGQSYEPLTASVFMRAHPWSADPEDIYTYTDDITGDLDAAKSVLSDAGWNWDDNGNLHFPEDADLSPRWPDGGVPDPNDFECLDSEGNLKEA